MAESNSANDEKNGDRQGTSSAHSPAMEIEGIVHGEPDNNVVQSGDVYHAEQPMEQVLSIVIFFNAF